MLRTNIITKVDINSNYNQQFGEQHNSKVRLNLWLVVNIKSISTYVYIKKYE